jgi:hypothetical protein
MPQIGFGAGTHQCIGQLLAQLQAGEITQALLNRGNIKLAGTAHWSHKSIIVRSLESLPLHLE